MDRRIPAALLCLGDPFQERRDLLHGGPPPLLRVLLTEGGPPSLPHLLVDDAATSQAAST